MDYNPIIMKEYMSDFNRQKLTVNHLPPAASLRPYIYFAGYNARLFLGDFSKDSVADILTTQLSHLEMVFQV
ncbi:hypothetical protein D3C80_1783420 [compost metagenome]